MARKSTGSFRFASRGDLRFTDPTSFRAKTLWPYFWCKSIVKRERSQNSLTPVLIHLISATMLLCINSFYGNPCVIIVSESGKLQNPCNTTPKSIRNLYLLYIPNYTGRRPINCYAVNIEEDR